MLQDVAASDNVAPLLRQLSDEVGRIAQALARMTGEEPATSSLVHPAQDGSAVGETPVDASYVRMVIRARGYATSSLPPRSLPIRHGTCCSI